MEGQPYTSGRWLVKAGEEEEFTKRWTDFTRWSLESVDGAEWFELVRDSNDPRRFLSFGAWADSDSIEAWRNSPEFSERLGQCRELCEEFEARDFRLASQVRR